MFKGFYELILSISTIIISIIAIVITIVTAKKQNKIALFDKRLECFNNLNKYFEGRGIFKSAEARLFGMQGQFKNGYDGKKTHLFSEVKLLFNDVIWKYVVEIDNLYNRIHQEDDKIVEYFEGLKKRPICNRSKKKYLNISK